MGCGDCGKKKKAKGTAGGPAIKQIITPCNDCVRTIRRCVVVPLPHGFVFSGGDVTVLVSPDLSCSISECTAASTTELCGVVFPGEVQLIEVRLTGIIQYVVNVPVIAENLEGTCIGTDVAFVSLSDSLAVDNVVCHVPFNPEFVCPDAICDVLGAVTATRIDLTCGDAPARGVGADLLFTLPNVCPPLV